jgi:menaquinone-dependent protoporphyrinogen oxidase
MRVLVVYGTTEGHTRVIARFIASRLRVAGHAVMLCDAADDAPPDPSTFDGVILAASLHLGHYQSALVHYVRHWRDALRRVPAAFVSVSLSAAGDDPDDLAGLDKCLRDFEIHTGWTPQAVSQVAGAILFSEYDFFRRFAMRAVAKKRGASTSADHDYTDYDALGRFVDGFVTRAAARPAA